MTLGQGIYDISMDEYVADPCEEPSVSTKVVMNVNTRSPKHAWLDHPRLGKKTSNARRADIGSAAHLMLLGGEDRITFGDWEDWRTKDAKAFRDDCRASGKIPLLQDDRSRLAAMVDKARPVVASFGAGKTEQTLIWHDQGVWCRSRPDWISDDALVVFDYKTANNADAHSWAKRTLFSGGYDIQAALVMRGLDVIRGEIQRSFYFVIQEIDPPYECSVVLLGPDAEEHAKQRVFQALGVWRRCLDTDRWPGYPHTTKERAYFADMPGWVMWDSEERIHAERDASNAN
jgi:hypothetical protein